MLKGKFIDVAGYFFGDEGKKYASDIEGAYANGGLSAIFEKISNDLPKYIEENKEKWLKSLEENAISIVGVIFGQDDASKVREYIEELHKTFESEGTWGVLKTIGEDLGRKILEYMCKIPFIAHVKEYIDNLRITFEQEGTSGVLETIGKDFARLIWKGIVAIATWANVTEFTDSLKAAFDEGGIEGLGTRIGEWIRTGIKSALTNLLGEDDAEAITSGLEFLDTQLFSNVSDAIESFKTTLETTIGNITDIVDKDTWENAKKTFGLVTGIISEIAIAITAMVGPAIEGLGDHVTDIVTFADRIFAFWGKIFDIFQDLYKSDWEKLGEDAADLGQITERIVESIVQMAENLLMTVTDMIVQGIASIIPGGEKFLEETWKPIMEGYRERQQLRREYGIINGNNAEGVLDYLIRNVKVGEDFINDLQWRYDILQNDDQLNYLIDYLDFLKEKGEEENKNNYEFYKEALTSYKEGIYDEFMTPYKEMTEKSSMWDLDEFVNAFYDWTNTYEGENGTLKDYLDTCELTNEQLQKVVEWGKYEYESLNQKDPDKYLFEGLDAFADTGTMIESAGQTMEEAGALMLEAGTEFQSVISSMDSMTFSDMMVNDIESVLGDYKFKNSLEDSSYALGTAYGTISQTGRRRPASKVEELAEKLAQDTIHSLLENINIKGAVEDISEPFNAFHKPKEYFVDEAEGLVEEVDRLAHRMDGTGQIYSYKLQSEDAVQAYLEEFKNLDFSSMIPEGGIDEDDLNYLKDLLEFSHNSDLTAEQNLADLKASLSYYMENSKEIPKEIKDQFLPLLTSEFTDLYIAQESLDTLVKAIDDGAQKVEAATKEGTKAVADKYDLATRLEYGKAVRENYLSVNADGSINYDWEGISKFIYANGLQTFTSEQFFDYIFGTSFNTGDLGFNNPEVQAAQRKWYDEMLASAKAQEVEVVIPPEKAAEIVDAIVPVIPESEEGESTTGGLLNLLFGNPEMYQALSEVLTPEVVQALQTLITTELNADPWTLFATALQTVSDSFTNMSAILKGGDEGEGLSTLLDNVLQKATALSGYFSGELSGSIDMLMSKLALTGVDENGEENAAGGNTLYTTWGWIYKLMLNTYSISMYLAAYWRSELPSAVDKLKKAAGDAIGVLQEMYSAAESTAQGYRDIVSAIMEVIQSLQDLDKANGGEGTVGEGGSGSEGTVIAKKIPGHAGGGTIFPYGTAIVGEHGPEIIRAGSSRLNVFANSQLMGEIASIRHAFNGLANSAEAVAYNRIMNGTTNSSNTDNSQHFENNFNGLMIGERQMKEMIEDTVRETWRKEMRLAS